MKKNLLSLKVLIFCLFFTCLDAQNTYQVQELKKDYLEHFSLNREYVYLHLNKTTLIPGEDLWLSAYIYNTTAELPHKGTTNLRVGIFDALGQPLKSHIIHITGGKGSSMFPIDKNEFPPGTYYLKATTLYMENFDEDLSYLQPFTVLGTAEEPTQEKASYDLQLLPEGGHLLEGTVNAVGVKMIDQNGNGAGFSNGVLLNSSGVEITRFQSNQFGMSRFFFTPLSSEEYTAVVTTMDGTKVRQKISDVLATGINLVTSQREDHFLISLRTNDQTLADLKDRDFLFTFHKDGRIRDFQVSFTEDEPEVTLIIPKDTLFPGANTITIFNDRLNPILERTIFNDKKLKRERLENLITNRSPDSLTLKLQNDLDKGISLSVSVLPGQTQSYQPTHDILSAFYLKPHLKGNIDDPIYYFSAGDTARKFYDLDLLLLTQGWSRYEWADQKKNPIEEIQNHEKGFTISGKLEKRNGKSLKNLFIGSEHFFEITSIKDDGSFNLENLFLTNQTELAFGLMDKKTSELSKPALSASVTPPKAMESPGKPVVTLRNTNYSDNLPHTYDVDLNELDTVVINAKKHMFIPELQIYDRGIEITREIAERYQYIADLIATKGFKVQYVQGQLEIRSFFISTISAPPPIDTYRTAQSNVMFYFNGVPTGTDPSFLNRMPTSEVESIVINKRGYGYGGQGVNGVIHINTKKGAYIPDRTERVLTILANNGYTANKEFYTPKYVSRNSAAYRKYGAVNWIPNLTFNSEGMASIAVEKDQHYKVFIQGMGADGSLISEELTIGQE